VIQIQAEKNLKAFNTFGVEAKANFFAEIQSVKSLIELANSDIWSKPKLILGGGSNILLMNDFDGLVVHVANKGIEIVREEQEYVEVRVQAGENWHGFVLYAIEKNWYGVENLSLIPGSVGASPMQNIGAYGVEINQVFVELEAFHIEKKEIEVFRKEDCEFGYRTSIFKTSHKDQYIITSVTFRLSKTPKLNLSYGAIMTTLEQMDINDPTPKDVSNAVIKIRQSKLPDPSIIGNSGSFFKNPVIPQTLFQKNLKQHPNMPHYVVDESSVKVPAGWLIDQCGFKGIIVGNTGTYKNQALIIVNRGGASGTEIWNFAITIQSKVEEEFGIELQPEVNLVG